GFELLTLLREALAVGLEFGDGLFGFGDRGFALGEFGFAAGKGVGLLLRGDGERGAFVGELFFGYGEFLLGGRDIGLAPPGVGFEAGELGFVLLAVGVEGLAI